MNIFGFKTWSRLHEDDSMPNDTVKPETRKKMTIDSPAHFIMNPEGVVIRTNLRHAILSDEELEKVLKEKHGLTVTHKIDDFKRVGSFDAQYDKKGVRRTASMRYTTSKNSNHTPNNKKPHYNLGNTSQRLSAQQQNERSVLYFEKLFRSNAEFTSSTKPDSITGKIKADCTLIGGKCLGENDGKNDIDIEIKPYARPGRSVHEHSRVHRHDAVINGSGGKGKDLSVKEYLDMLEKKDTDSGNIKASDTYPSWKIFQHITKNFPDQYFQGYKFTGTPTDQETAFRYTFSKPEHKYVYRNEIRKWWDPDFEPKKPKPQKEHILAARMSDETYGR